MGGHQHVLCESSAEKPVPRRVDDFTVTRHVIQPSSQEAGLCLYYAALNCLDSECRMRFSGDTNDIERCFLEIASRHGHDSSTGYSAHDISEYLQWLRSEGHISGYTWKRLYVRHKVLVSLKYDGRTEHQVVTVDPYGLSHKDIISGRGFHVGDRLVLFGLAPTSEMKQRITKAIRDSSKVGRGSQRKLSSNAAMAVQVRTLNEKVYTITHMQKESKEECPGHAVSVWYMSPGEVSGLEKNRSFQISQNSHGTLDSDAEDSAESGFGGRKRPVPILFDSAKKVVQVLTAETWAYSMTGVVRAYRFSVTP